MIDFNDEYKKYNENLFEAYCKTAIDHAIHRARIKKERRNQHERSLSTMTSSELLVISANNEICLPEETWVFYVLDQAVRVNHSRLGQAISFLLPKDRDIILMYYFLDLKDREIALLLNMSHTAVQSHRNAAREKLKTMLEIEL